MNVVERGLRAVDRVQQARRLPAFVVGVVRKFGDDRGALLSALITYYAFTAVFPLLLLLTTVLGFTLHDNPSAQQAVLNSALADFPVIGTQLHQNVHSLQGSGLGVAIGAFGLLYGALGVAQALQFMMAQVWAIPRARRPGFLTRLWRGLGLFAVLAVGLLTSTAAAALLGEVTGGWAGRVLGLVASAGLNIALYLACFRVLTPREVPLRALVPGCLVAGPIWTVLQLFGGLLVAHELRHANAVYGLFGTVLGLLTWLYLGAQITVYAAETNVVRARRLWPRSLLQPPLTEADRQVRDMNAEQEQARSRFGSRNRGR